MNDKNHSEELSDNKLSFFVFFFNNPKIKTLKNPFNWHSPIPTFPKKSRMLLE